MKTQLPLSVVVIALNEEARIERCLNSVPFAAEKIVVDSFSTDKTVEVATRCGARVVQEKWRGFGPQKAFATDLAKNDWVLSLDADEALSPELAQEIQDRFASLDVKTGYRLPRLSFHMGRWIRHGGWYPDAQLRLFNRRHSQWNQSALHEKVEAAQVEIFKQPLWHWVFRDLTDQVSANNRYSGLGAEELHRRGVKFSLLKLAIKPQVKFLETYVWKQGFRDGLPGFVIAVGAAYSIFLRWAKLWEIERGLKK